MKTLWFAVFLLGSCASWNQKDFEKDLEKSPEASSVFTEEQAPILEKFEVTEVKEKPAPVVKEKIKKVSPKKIEASKKATTPEKKEAAPKN